jgi:hypothetical protein
LVEKQQRADLGARAREAGRCFSRAMLREWLRQLGVPRKDFSDLTLEELLAAALERAGFTH